MDLPPLFPLDILLSDARNLACGSHYCPEKHSQKKGRKHKDKDNALRHKHNDLVVWCPLISLLNIRLGLSLQKNELDDGHDKRRE
jgi:hypothetical protein